MPATSNAAVDGGAPLNITLPPLTKTCCGTLHAATGNLERIKRIVKLMVLVNCSETFTEQHLVANGAMRVARMVWRKFLSAHVWRLS